MMIYAGSILAERQVSYQGSYKIETNHNVVIVLSYNEDEAIGKMYKLCYRNYPANEGYTGYAVVCYKVPDGFIVDAMKSIKYNRD
jgi:hypothetical protein